MEVVLNPVQSLRGIVYPPGDKSISHRAVMIGALAQGETEIDNFLYGEDCLSTIKVLRALGVQLDTEDKRVIVHGVGLHGLKAPNDILDAGNSGTTMRLMAGILSGCNFFSVLTGDSSLRRRPMKRLIKPLTEMGAVILARDGSYGPLAISGGGLKGITYRTTVASAQVKSAILLAGLLADGETRVIEPESTRDHTERMLNYFGAQVDIEDKQITLHREPKLSGRRIEIPGDISAAAFLLVAGAIVPNSKLLLRNVGINNTRGGVLRVLKEMGANIDIINERQMNSEPVADIQVSSSALCGTTISGALIPNLIDELPALAIAASIAQGVTVVKNAAELRVKESDRISAIVNLLRGMGVDTTEQEDGYIIRGGQPLKGTEYDSQGDHRMAMAAAIAALVAEGNVTIKTAECVKISFPGFFDVLKYLTKGGKLLE